MMAAKTFRNEDLKGLSHEFFARVAKLSLHAGVDENDIAEAVHDHYAVGRSL